MLVVAQAIVPVGAVYLFGIVWLCFFLHNTCIKEYIYFDLVGKLHLKDEQQCVCAVFSTIQCT